MSICSPCIRLNEISLCTDSIIIGTVAQSNTLYNIYFISLATGIKVHYQATSDVNGLLILTPDDPFVLASDHLYEVFVNTTNSPSIGEDLTIDSTTAKCYQVSFIQVVDYPFIEQTFSIA